MSPSTAASKRSQIVLQVLALVVLCAVLAGLAVAFDIFAPTASEHLITMRVETSGGYAQITYKDATGKLLEAETVSTPWERSAVNPSGTQVYLTAANPTGSGSIQCILKLDRKEWKTDKAQFPDDSVACGGIVP